MPPSISVDRLEPRTHFAAGDPLDVYGTDGIAAMPTALRTAFPSQIATLRGGAVFVSIGAQKTRAGREIRSADFVRFDTGGLPDRSFGGTGSVDSFFTSVRAIAVRSDGKFLAYGYVADPAYRIGAGYRWYVARFRDNGSLDRTFGHRGAVQLDASVLKKLPQDQVHLSVDGAVTIAGLRQRALDGYDDARLLRFRPDGRADASFGDGGVVKLLSTEWWYYRLFGMRVAPDGSVFIAEWQENPMIPAGSAVVPAVRKFTPAGNADAIFGDAGKYVYEWNTVPMNVFLAGGDVLVPLAGYAVPNRLMRLDAQGRPKSGFGDGGSVAFPDDFNPRLRTAVGQADGKLVIVSHNGDAIRLNADGGIDESFGRIILPGSVDTPGISGQLFSAGESRVFASSLTGLGTADSYDITGERTLVIQGTAGDDLLTLANNRLQLPIGSPLIARGEGWFRHISPDRYDQVSMIGGAGNDTLIYQDTIPGALYGGAGNDTIYVGYQGFADAGDGDDTIVGNGERYTIHGGRGNDLIKANSYFVDQPRHAINYTSFLYGGDGKDVIRTSGERTSAGFQIFGDAGDDYLRSGLTSDTITGGPGRDTLLSGGGIDTFIRDDDDAE